MKKILNNRLFLVIVTALICTSVTVLGANFLAKDIKYTPADTSWGVDNVEAAINSLALSKTATNYSTTEQVVGTWIDGKPLYQKSINFSIASSDKWSSVYNITNEEIKYISGYAKKDDFLMTLGEYRASDFCLIHHTTNSVINLIAWHHNGGTFTGTLTIQYTKTTDIVSN